jgi:energy-converting hydrogenase Eha subunit G
MAAQLKQQGRALQFSLEQDKGILGRALEGLDINLTGLEAASKNMAFLRRMSEEEGWLGRLKLYGMIFAMWISAFLLVFVCPKLRF